MTNPSLIVLLVEDNRQQQLMYRYLRKLDLEPHAIRITKAPLGAGSAEQWVRGQFPSEVIEYRRRHAITKLIVVIDADTNSVRDRMRQLDDSLKSADVRPIDDGDHIARLIPRRNIETWILCLNLEQVDEDIDYKRQHRDWDDLIPPAAETLQQWTRSIAGIPRTCVDSLRRGIAELQRIKC